jgi:hypothetical protein
VAIVFRVTRAVEALHAQPGDTVVIDRDDEEVPVSVVRGFARDRIVSVLRYLDAFELVSPRESLSDLFDVVGQDPPQSARESSDAPPLRRQDGGAS